MIWNGDMHSYSYSDSTALEVNIDRIIKSCGKPFREWIGRSIYLTTLSRWRTVAVVENLHPVRFFKFLVTSYAGQRGNEPVRRLALFDSSEIYEYRALPRASRPRRDKRRPHPIMI